MKQSLSCLFLSLSLIFTACGGGSSTSNNPGGGNNNPTPEPINTEKLVGTPFEGMTTGDDIPFYYFQCNEFKTETITGFPMKVFLAFFTPTEEAIIEEGIQAANDGIGFEAYEITDTWENTDRVIYKVNIIKDDFVINFNNPLATTLPLTHRYNSKTYSDVVMPDWSIELESTGVNKNTVAHELGHASGIIQHKLIDYDNDVLLDLSVDSIMNSSGGTGFTDYDFMMEKQGEIMEAHLGVMGNTTTLCFDVGLED